jgi:deazaflavin-dependent oxidoreductase (nitroreductase family)
MSGADAASRVRSLILRLHSTRPMSALEARSLHHVDRLVFRTTSGRTTLSSWISGLPIVMLTTTGARTGRRSTLPVVGLADGDRVVVIASNFGRRHHPGWYHNLRAHPRALLRVGGRTREVRARELDGPERDREYARGVAINPAWRAYPRWAGSRRIPVVSLEPVARP